jgi:hypothetical protein
VPSMGIIITIVIISRLTINAGIMILLTITAIGKANDLVRGWRFMARRVIAMKSAEQNEFAKKAIFTQLQRLARLVGINNGTAEKSSAHNKEEGLCWSIYLTFPATGSLLAALNFNFGFGVLFVGSLFFSNVYSGQSGEIILATLALIRMGLARIF